MSKLKQSIFMKKLDHLLAYSDDDAFLQMVWAVDALQAGREQSARKHLAYPIDAATTDMGSRLAIHKWELETLVNRLLITRKTAPARGTIRQVNCSAFAACATAVNHLRKLEDAESNLYLGKFSVLTEMHRIGHRQFHWQRGYFNSVQLYRYAYLYGQGECGAYFEATHGISFNDFSAIGFGLYGGFQEYSSVQRTYSLQVLGISDNTRERGLGLLSLSLRGARIAAAELAQNVNANLPRSLPVAYQPSLLRRFPVIESTANPGMLRSPLPELIIQRITSGVYYDLVAGPGRLRNEASDRFEQYTNELLTRMLPALSSRRGFKYQANGNRVDAPDVLLETPEGVRLIIECKATKLTIAAQFGEDPLEEANKSYQEIAKGVLQIWKFASHVRRNLARDVAMAPQASGMVLTLDNWLVMSNELQDRVIAEARQVADRDPEITEADRRHVIFCSISDLEATLSFSDEDSFLSLLSSAREDQFKGWVLPVINSNLAEYSGEKKSHPFDLGDVLPWWAATEDMRDKRRAEMTLGG